MPVLVTGGTGLVGTRLIHRLRQREDAVVVLTRRPEACARSWTRPATSLPAIRCRPATGCRL